jgi:hypothetical protein
MRFHDWEVVPTNGMVFDAIKTGHPDMLVFSSMSDPTGTAFGGSGEVSVMETTWGLPTADFPLIGLRSTWSLNDTGDRHGSGTHEFWLVVARATGGEGPWVK